jgi:hypothetical protein
MRKHWLTLILLLTAATSTHAQWPWPAPPPPPYYPPPPPPEHDEHALTLGLWDEFGVQGKLGPGIQPLGVETAGVYAELSKHRLRPALEVRGTFSENGVRGTLTGPRIAWKVDNILFYASGLFGPNLYRAAYLPTQPKLTPVDHHGITSEAAAGFEFMGRYHPNWGFRMEVTSGRFTGMPQSYPLTLAGGVVLRIP